MTTEYVGAYVTRDGYNGRTKIVHLCFDPETGKTLLVHELGWFTALHHGTSADDVRLLLTTPEFCMHYR